MSGTESGGRSERAGRGEREERGREDEADDAGEAGEAGEAGDDGGRDEISPWEWVVGAFGLALVLAAIAFLTYEGRQPRTPPDIVVSVDSITRVGSGYLAHVRARNRGRAPAAAVTVQGELAGPGADTARAETMLDYVPGRSEATGGLYFPRDPRVGTLTVRAGGYQSP